MGTVNAEFDVENFGAIPLPLAAHKKVSDRLHKVRELVMRGEVAVRENFPEYNALTRAERNELMRYGWTFDGDRMGKPLIGLSDSKKIEFKRWQMAQRRSSVQTK